jgi:ketosteroid isomerase-like protein
MSEENVELVRRGHDAFRDSGEEAIFEYLHADIDLTPVEELLDGETFHGHDGVRRFFQMLREAFGDFGWEPQEFVDQDDHVIVATRFFAAGRGSGVPVEAMIYNVWTVRHGKAIRVRGYLSRSDALEAAGLSA